MNKLHGIFIHINKMDSIKLNNLYGIYSMISNDVIIYDDDGYEEIKSKMFIINNKKIQELILNNKYIIKPFIKNNKCSKEYKECILNNCREFELNNEYIEYLRDNVFDKYYKNGIKYGFDKYILNNMEMFDIYKWKDIKKGIKKYNNYNLCVLKGYIISYKKGCYLLNEIKGNWNKKDITNIIGKLWYYANENNVNNINKFEDNQKIWINNWVSCIVNNKFKGIKCIGVLNDEQKAWKMNMNVYTYIMNSFTCI